MRLRIALLGVALATAARAQSVDLGHKLLGTLGLQAGSVAPEGLYFQGAFLGYAADQIIDRNGQEVPVDPNLHAYAGLFGTSATLAIPHLATRYTASVGVPIARIHATTSRPDLDTDRFGLADIFVQPVKLGWCPPHVDLVAAYDFYVPTSRFEKGPEGSVSSAQWTHQFSAGGTWSIDRERSWQLSALASYDNYRRKEGIDITRGDIVQIQGGFGKTLAQTFDAGVVAGALWQVRPDRGADLPAQLAGARDEVVSVGGEAGVLIVALRSRVVIRCEREVMARSRPEGETLFVSAAVKAW